MVCSLDVPPIILYRVLVAKSNRISLLLILLKTFVISYPKYSMRVCSLIWDKNIVIKSPSAPFVEASNDSNNKISLRIGKRPRVEKNFGGDFYIFLIEDDPLTLIKLWVVLMPLLCQVFHCVRRIQ